ncbi:MAG TPA: hypothetical protein VGG48_09730 [Rhizomicrobium sp.]|jgi:hypothetical protein
MKAFAIAALAASLFATEAVAQDHLVPEESVIGGSEFSPGYHDLVSLVFADAYKPNVRARVIVEQRSAPEAAVGISERDGQWWLFSLEASERIWPRPSRDVTARRYEIAIDPELGQRIVAVWTAMLYGAHYDRPVQEREQESVLVGNILHLHFSARVGGQILAGGVTGPTDDSAPGLLAHVAGDIDDYCRAPNPDTRAALERGVARLEARLLEERRR